jgi:hypothetical protein
LAYSYSRQKQERKYDNFLHCPFDPPANQHSQSSPDGQIGCAGWLVAQKDNVGRDFFSLPALAYKSRPNHIFSRDMFFNRHFELIFETVIYI